MEYYNEMAFIYVVLLYKIAFPSASFGLSMLILFYL